MDYKFYIQQYPQEVWNTRQDMYNNLPKGEILDIEKTFHCKYIRFDGISENGKVKNLYMETFAEEDTPRLHIPKDVIYDNTNVSLTLLFEKSSDNNFDIQENEQLFFNTISGRKIEYHDTFRNRYLTLMLIDKPEKVAEVLYGDTRYRQVKYTFKNLYGKSFETSQIR